MFSHTLTSLLAFTAGLSGVSAAPSLSGRSVDGNFSLFAFGAASDTVIGGFPIFYHDGDAYIADPSKVNRTNEYVRLNKNSSAETQWIANPLLSETATWSNSTFYVTVPFGPIGFYKEGQSNNVSTDALLTTGFRFYGTTAFLTLDGKLQSLWYAVKTSTDGLWTVGWNATGAGFSTDQAELLTLKAVTAPNVDFPGPQRSGSTTSKRAATLGW